MFGHQTWPRPGPDLAHCQWRGTGRDGCFSTEIMDMAEGRASWVGGTTENNTCLLLPWHSFLSFMPLSLLSRRVCQDYQARPGQQVTLAGRCSDHDPLKKLHYPESYYYSTMCATTTSPPKLPRMHMLYLTGKCTQHVLYDIV